MALVTRLTQGLPDNDAAVCGAGDDCAVLDLGVPGQWVLFKADSVVEGVHFLPDDEPQRVGHKALARALSDVAAMGGRPVSALVTLGIPGEPRIEYLEQLYQGLNQLAARWKVAISGGETVRNPGGLSVGISVVGLVNRERCLFRSGARPGDGLFVSGELGGSRSGRHLDFEPRLEEGIWLAETGWVRSLMDLSDGLALDLGRMQKASGNLGVMLEESAIPVSREARARAQGGGQALEGLMVEEHRARALRAALTDGEDFELLFSVEPGRAVALMDGWRERFPGVPVHCIGRFESAPGLRIRGRTGVREIAADGYQHFQES